MSTYKIAFAFLLSLLLHDLNGQEYLVKNNGDRIRYKKMKFRQGDILLLGTKEGGKLSIDPDEVKGRYSLKSNTMLHIKSALDVLGEKKFHFVPRVMEGKIKVYERTVYNYTYNAYGGTNTSNTYLYLEKGDEYFNVLSTNTIGQNKKEKLEKFKTIVQDDQEALQLLNESSYKHKMENIKDVIRTYNLNAHQPENSTTQRMGDVIIFRTEENQREENIELSIGGVMHTLELNDSITVKIPANAETKICILNARQATCDLIRSVEYFDTYYEVALLTKDDEGVIEARDKEYSEYVLKTLELYRQRRAKKK